MSDRVRGLLKITLTADRRRSVRRRRRRRRRRKNIKVKDNDEI